MNIVYISEACSIKKYNELTQKNLLSQLPQAQKYNRLLIEGIAQNIDGDVIAVTSYSINRTSSKKLMFKSQYEKQDNIEFRYLSFINILILRQLCLFINCFVQTYRYLRSHRDTVIVCNANRAAMSSAARIAGKIFKIKKIGIWTDIPGLTSGAKEKTFSSINRIYSNTSAYIKSKRLDLYDGYVLLSEDMNDLVNKNNKPYVVIEGHSDIKMTGVDNDLDRKTQPKAIVYTGGIHEEYGIKALVEAFVKIDNSNWQLNIYGYGNYEDKLKKICENNSNVKYFGVVDNAKAVQAQISATLLVNPRYTDAEYVKFSFPSKNMEYMASGTPLMTTNLPAMPDDHKAHVYLINDESEQGFVQALRDAMSFSPEQLHEMGIKAKKFMMEEKNNIVQAKKIVDMIEQYFESEREL